MLSEKFLEKFFGLPKDDDTVYVGIAKGFRPNDSGSRTLSTWNDTGLQTALEQFFLGHTFMGVKRTNEKIVGYKIDKTGITAYYENI